MLRYITDSLFLLFAVCLISTDTVYCAFPNVYKRIESTAIEGGDPGEPLFLTPLIKEGKIIEAQNASKVSNGIFYNIKSHSGYLTVNEKFNSNTFFWFFPAEEDYKNAPVLLWLQGGPGSSSLFGLFTENGPFVFKNSNELNIREYRWSKPFSVLYIDNPVGTGFSFTNEDGYAYNETQIGEDLYEALQQFFTMFPELQKNDFVITGESYAGKYIPAIAYTIMKKNPKAKLKINLTGLSIGNGWIDPEHQMEYGDYLYQIGLIDYNTRKVFKEQQEIAIKYMKNKDFGKAFDVVDDLIDGDLNGGKSLFKNATGFENYLNYLYSTDPLDKDVSYMTEFFKNATIRAALHVGNYSFDSKGVEERLKNDTFDTVAPWLSKILSNYRVMLYNGQLDIIVAYPLTENFIKHLEFSGSDEYKSAERTKWYVGEDLAGYVKQAGNLTEVLFRNAGHMVPTDQPKWCLDLLTRFVKNKPFN